MANPRRRGLVATSALDRFDVQEQTAQDLIEAIARRRDRAAFGELFRYFAPRLKSYAMRSGAAPAAAEEVAQEAMIQVWRRAETYDRTKAGASTWIFTIARNKRIDLLRRERLPEIEPADAESPPADAETAETAESDFLTQEAGRILRGAIDELPADQADVLRKVYFEDKSHSAVSAETGLPLGTVKSRVRLGLARLRVLMAGLDA